MQEIIVFDCARALCRASLPDWEWELELAWQLFQAEKAHDDATCAWVRQELTIGNLPLAAVLARRYAHSTDEFDELFSAGALGLVEAASRYDPARPVPFRSFARYWIRGTIFSSMSRRFRAWVPLSLDRPLTPDGESTLADYYIAPPPPLPSDPAPLYAALRQLPDELRQVVQVRYSVGEVPHTQIETGQHLHLSRMQVQRREHAALGQLRALLQSSGDQDQGGTA